MQGRRLATLGPAAAASVGIWGSKRNLRGRPWCVEVNATIVTQPVIGWGICAGLGSALVRYRPMRDAMRPFLRQLHPTIFGTTVFAAVIGDGARVVLRI